MMVWKGTPWFMEIQLSDYSTKQWKEKMNRFERYYQSNECHSLAGSPRTRYGMDCRKRTKSDPSNIVEGVSCIGRGHG